MTTAGPIQNQMPSNESTRGASESARAIANLRWNANAHARANASDWRPLLRSLIEETAFECRDEGWDGYQGKAISEGAKRMAQLLADALPFRLPTPDVVPDPEGEIALSWDFGPGHILTVSIDSTGTVSYAGLLGRGVRRYGREPFRGEIPKVVEATLEELCERAGIVV